MLTFPLGRLSLQNIDSSWTTVQTMEPIDEALVRLSFRLPVRMLLLPCSHLGSIHAYIHQLLMSDPSLCDVFQNQLKTVFLNGDLIIDETFDTVRLQ